MAETMGRFVARFTFDNFVVGKTNELAWARVSSLCHHPEREGSFIYLYSDHGLGKTHLLHAAGNALIARGIEETRLLLLCSATAQAPSLPEGAYLFIDDLDAGNATVQERLGILAAEVLSRGGNVVATGHRPAEDPHFSAPALKTCLAHAEQADILPPEEELLLAILQRAMEAEGITLPEEAVSFLVTNFSHDVGKLLGALQRVKAFSLLNHGEITFLSTLRALHEFVWPVEKDRT